MKCNLTDTITSNSSCTTWPLNAGGCAKFSTSDEQLCIAIHQLPANASPELTARVGYANPT
jgi:hypothetical protein